MQSPIISIMTNTLEKSVQFYTEILGFTTASRMELPGVVLQFLQHQAVTVELVSRADKPEFTVGNGVVLTFLAESLTEILAKLAASGEPVPAPFTLPSGVEMVRFTDPNGVIISFVNESTIHH